MGILNVTPDSFSDAGRYLHPDKALAHASDLVDQGADIVDFGGESTRPGASPVSAGEEADRVLPVIEAFLAEFPEVPVSIDTSKASVARAAVRAGARIINDVTGLTGDPEMIHVAASTGAGIVVMHMRGRPQTMQRAPRYRDVLREVRAFLLCQGRRAIEAGLAKECLAFDPGLGFGKTLDHNLQILKHLGAFGFWQRPVLLGASKKSFIGKVLQSDCLATRKWPTVALTSYAIEQGARIIRVHDVRPNVQAARMTEAILRAS